MHWADTLMTAGIAIVAVPITTLLTLWIRWWWNHPKIKYYLARRKNEKNIDKNGNFFLPLNIDKNTSSMRININKIYYYGENKKYHVFFYDVGEVYFLINDECEIPERVKSLMSQKNKDQKNKKSKKAK